MIKKINSEILTPEKYRCHQISIIDLLFKFVWKVLSPVRDVIFVETKTTQTTVPLGTE